MTRKILALHGLAQSGEYFSSKTKGLRSELEKLGYEIIYATAPNNYSPADIPDSLGDVIPTNVIKDVLAWLEKDLRNNSYVLPKTSIEYLHDFVIENGPFDGVLGFSQGAGITGYLATDLNGLLNLTEEQQPPLKFIMVFSGFRLTPKQYQKQYNDHPITIPSLHVQGDLDTISDPFKIEALFNSCTPETRTLLKHAGGHYVPNSKGFAKKVTDWLQTIYP